MATAASLTLFLSLSLIIPSLAAAANTTTANDLIEQVCNHTLHFDLCTESLSAEHNSHGADTRGLAAISIRLAAESAATVSGYISGLLEGVMGDDSELEQCLSDCSESYMDAVEQLDDSTVAIDSGAYANVNTWVTASMTDADACEESCGEVAKEKKAELTTRNGHFTNLCSIALSITNLLTTI